MILKHYTILGSGVTSSLLASVASSVPSASSATGMLNCFFIKLYSLILTRRGERGGGGGKVLDQPV